MDFELELNKCGDCHAGYRGKDGLLSHIKSNHEGGKNSCEHYEYKTRDKSNLKKHRDSKPVTIIPVTSVSTIQNNISVLRNTINQNIER